MSNSWYDNLPELGRPPWAPADQTENILPTMWEVICYKLNLVFIQCFTSHVTGRFIPMFSRQSEQPRIE